MAAAVIPTSMEQFVSQDCSVGWKISKLLRLGSKHIRTPAFSPLPDHNLKFCFDVWYEVFDIQKSSCSSCVRVQKISIFKLMLVKLESTGVSESMKLQVDVKLTYSDGSLFKEYRELPCIIVNEMDNLCFDTILSDDIIYSPVSGLCETTHFNNMIADALFLQCHMKFFNHIKSPFVIFNHIKSPFVKPPHAVASKVS